LISLETLHHLFPWIFCCWHFITILTDFMVNTGILVRNSHKKKANSIDLLAPLYFDWLHHWMDLWNHVCEISKSFATKSQPGECPESTAFLQEYDKNHRKGQSSRKIQRLRIWIEATPYQDQKSIFFIQFLFIIVNSNATEEDSVSIFDDKNIFHLCCVRRVLRVVGTDIWVESCVGSCERELTEFFMRFLFDCLFDCFLSIELTRFSWLWISSSDSILFVSLGCFFLWGLDLSSWTKFLLRLGLFFVSASLFSENNPNQKQKVIQHHQWIAFHKVYHHRKERFSIEREVCFLFHCY
jgi:hypothetical protein